MSKLKVLLCFEDEAKVCEIDQGATMAEIIALFHQLFQNRGGDILQARDSSFGSSTWVNCDESPLKSDAREFRLIKSNAQKLELGNLCPSTSIVFCCDMQERFRPAIKYFNEIASVGGRILQAANILNIPVVVTEQYPRGLGKTVDELDISHASLVAEKTKFSMLVSEVEAHLLKLPLVKSVVLFGVEAHVCIQQTVLDLIQRGFEVHIVADATSSRSLADRQLAFQRLRRSGGFVTTAETVLLQWVADKQHEQFKPIQNLIKELPPDTGLQLKSSI